MTEERRGEIALALVETEAAENGFPSPRRLKSRVAKLSKETTIPKEELLEFYRTLVPLLYGKLFGYKEVRVSITGTRDE
jgi:hypothetical protein